jgi:hypothetical protein
VAVLEQAVVLQIIGEYLAVLVEHLLEQVAVVEVVQTQQLLEQMAVLVVMEFQVVVVAVKMQLVLKQTLLAQVVRV